MDPERRWPKVLGARRAFGDPNRRQRTVMPIVAEEIRTGSAERDALVQRGPQRVRR
jgi:hypothetical protein